ncbi:MAG: ERCC4 domain-containing protein [Desulfomonilaceae bacterium]|jgi:ERCC4-type nuclease
MGMNDEQITLIKDTREPDTAWDMYFSAPTVTACLRTGDYSVSGYEDQVAIERKTIDDLVGCLGKQRDRFERELERSRGFEYFAVLVESSYFELENGLYRSRLHPRSGVESVSAFEVRYKVPFLFCGSAELAAKKCESLLRKYHREQMKQIETELPF